MTCPAFFCAFCSGVLEVAPPAEVCSVFPEPHPVFSRATDNTATPIHSISNERMVFPCLEEVGIVEAATGLQAQGARIVSLPVHHAARVTERGVAAAGEADGDGTHRAVAHREI